MKNTKKSIVAMATEVNKVDEKEKTTKIVANVDFTRLYDNKLSTNIKDLGKENAKTLKTLVTELMQDVAKKNKNSKHIQVIITADEKTSMKNAIASALNVKIEQISNSMLEKAVLSGMKNKFVRQEKGVKVEGWAYSVSDFLKSINASIFKTINK